MGPGSRGGDCDELWRSATALCTCISGRGESDAGGRARLPCWRWPPAICGPGRRGSDACRGQAAATGPQWGRAYPAPAVPWLGRA
eukprot:3691896-Pyramimonas_sp.AAC.1